MAKKHISQTHKQSLGQFFTTNSDYILSGYEHLIQGKDVVDPFSGGWDLLSWANRAGANTLSAYDIEPVMDNTIKNDSLVNPPTYAGRFVVSNPPYLACNKCKIDKSVYSQWGQDDYYKCHLASLFPNDCSEGIFILPSNFLSESNAKARTMLLQNYTIVSGKYWKEKVFDDATTGICVIHIKKEQREIHEFPLMMYPENVTVNVTLEKRYGYLHGKDFFDYIAGAPTFDLIKTDVGMPAPNTRIVVGLLGAGKFPFGISYNEGEPVFCKPKSFTTYQLTIPGLVLTEKQQRDAVNLFQEKLNYFQEKYYGMFLANYMGADQKILSRRYAQLLFCRVLVDLKIVKNLETFFV